MTDDKNGLTQMLPHQRIVNFDEMNRALLAHHRLHFGQAQSTPFTVSPLKELIGYTAEGPLAKQLKEGTAKVKELNLEEHTTDILEELTWQEHFPPKNSADMYWMQLCHGFKIWNERTATSPLGRYL
eukprot:7118272-Ditylum_brightwellii.AAC.1